MRLLVVCLVLSAFLVPKPLTASGVIRPEPDFSFRRRPDLPHRFAAGSLGVVRPTWAVSYLVVAYRYLAGLTPTAAQRKEFIAVWDKRFHHTPAQDDGSQDALSAWLNARKTVAGENPKEVQTYKRAPGRYFTYSNCYAGAFEKAAQTLEKRVKYFGASSQAARDWLAAQDMVFENCSGEKSAAVPAEPSSTDPALIRFDRAYQIASAHFYAGEFDAAERDFGRIAADPASPWRAWARFALTRSIVRRADLQAKNVDDRAALAAQASAKLADILNDRSLAEVHRAATSLLRIVCAHFDDPAAASFVALRILDQNSSEELYRNFEAYSYRPNLTYWNRDRTLIEPTKAKDDLTAWIGAFDGQGDKRFAQNRWRENHTLPWLVASLAHADPTDPALPEMLAEASKVGADSPAWPTVTYYRLSLEPSKANARQELDSLLSAIGRLPASSRNLFAGLRFSVASDLDDLLRHAPRVPAAILEDEGEENGDFTAGWRPLLDEDAALVFNQELPLKILVEAVKRDILPGNLRDELARMTWVRAILLEDRAGAEDIARLLRSLPNAAPREGLSKDLAAFLAAKSPPERDLAAAVAIGRNPGLSCFVNHGFQRTAPPEELARRNWWHVDITGTGQRQGKAPPSVLFLDETQRSTARAEYQKILSLGGAPAFLSRSAMKAVKELPDDPKVPELLHDVVKACYYLRDSYAGRDASIGEMSKAAFQTLHSHYPSSKWTERTPYWYQ